MDYEAYLKKVVNFEHCGKSLRFRVSQDLFSSFQVDVGSRFLLRTLMPAGTHSFRKVLDLGCGYGPLGLVLKSAREDCVVHMVDRDALAVEFTRQNARLNGLSGIRVYGSLGYDDVNENDFDLVVSNIPGKAGDRVITHLITDARHFLRPGGLAAIVVVAAIESMVRNILESTPDIDIIFHQTRYGHAVFHYSFKDTVGKYESAFSRGIYNRDEADFSFRKLKYHMRTAHGLPEFGSLHYRTMLLMEGLCRIDKERIKRAVIFNTGQGHVPVFLWHVLQPANITLTDRDLLSLRYSQKNLAINGCHEKQIGLLHSVGFSMDPGEQADLIAGVLREEEGPDAVFQTVKEAADFLAPEGLMLLAAGSTAISRLVEKVRQEKRLEVVERTKRRGYCLIMLKPIKSV